MEKLPDHVVIVHVDHLPKLRPPHWRCRRPGLWSCWWLGRYYASARKVKTFDGRADCWRLTIFSPGGGRGRGCSASFWSLRMARAMFDAALPPRAWNIKTLALP